MEAMVFYPSDYEIYNPDFADQNGNGFTVKVSSGESAVYGFYVPVSEIPGYEYCKYEVSVVYPNLSIAAFATGYLNAWGKFTAVDGAFDFNSDMLRNGEFIVPCVRVDAARMATTARVSDFYMTVETGNETSGGYKIYLGSKPIERIMLGGKEINAVALGSKLI